MQRTADVAREQEEHVAKDDGRAGGQVELGRDPDSRGRNEQSDGHRDQQQTPKAAADQLGGGGGNDDQGAEQQCAQHLERESDGGGDEDAEEVMEQTRGELLDVGQFRTQRAQRESTHLADEEADDDEREDGLANDVVQIVGVDAAEEDAVQEPVFAQPGDDDNPESHAPCEGEGNDGVGGE